jgi:hypothetical protein
MNPAETMQALNRALTDVSREIKQRRQRIATFGHDLSQLNQPEGAGGGVGRDPRVFELERKVKAHATDLSDLTVLCEMEHELNGMLGGDAIHTQAIVDNASFYMMTLLRQLICATQEQDAPKAHGFGIAVVLLARHVGIDAPHGVAALLGVAARI